MVRLSPVSGSAYMSTRHVKSPSPLFPFFLTSSVPFSCSTAPQEVHGVR
jgi:hypothetical protein